MALTAAQVGSVFEILEVPFSTSYNTVDNMGSLTASVNVNGTGQSAAKTALSAAITALAAADETKVTALVTEWDSIRLNVGSMESGGVTDANGLTFSFESKRQQIKKLMQVYLPFFRYHEVLAAQSGHAPYRMIVR